MGTKPIVAVVSGHSSHTSPGLNPDVEFLDLQAINYGWTVATGSLWNKSSSMGKLLLPC